MDDDELLVIQEWNDKRWKQFGGKDKEYFVVRDLIAEVRRQRAENRAMQSRLDIAEGRVEGMREEIENLAGELRDEQAYAKELRDNLGQAGIY